MAHAENSRASAQSAAEVLVSFVASKGQTLQPSDSRSICEKLDLVNLQELKPKAKPLRAELALRGVTLRQSHALEVLAQIAGHENWMRAKQRTSEPPSIYGLLTSVEGEHPQPQVFQSFGEAVTGLLSTAIGLIPTRREPAFCSLARSPIGLQLEVSQASGSWFSLQLLKFPKQFPEGEELTPLPLGEDALRTALRKVVANIEQARPGALVLRGTISDTLPPWYCAAFHVTGLHTASTRMVSDERELFLLFDAAGSTELTLEHGDALLRGPVETFRVEPVWVDLSGNDNEARKAEGASMVKSVFQRYERYRAALPDTITQAFRDIGGNTGEHWHTRANYETLEQLASKKNLSFADLARKAEVSYRDIMRLRDYELAAPDLLLKLARVLEVTPTVLQAQKPATLGFTAENASQFLKLVSGAMAYRAVEGNSLLEEDLPDVQVLLETAKDISELAAFEDGPFSTGEWDAGDPAARLERAAQDLLNEAAAARLKLVIAREVEFVRTGKGGNTDDFMAMNVLTFCAERIDGGTPAMWVPIRKEHSVTGR
jgi:Glyoxalase superfamily protein